jgi:hypothetical protein
MLLEGFALPDLIRVSRVTVVTGLIVGVLGLVGALALNAPLVGLGIAVGVGLGILNFRMIVKSVAKQAGREGEHHRRPLAANTVRRLAAITVIALGLCFLSIDVGLGTMAGLALFQFILLATMARSMFKLGNGGISGMLDAAQASFAVPDDDGDKG